MRFSFTLPKSALQRPLIHPLTPTNGGCFHVRHCPLHWKQFRVECLNQGHNNGLLGSRIWTANLWTTCSTYLAVPNWKHQHKYFFFFFSYGPNFLGQVRDSQSVHVAKASTSQPARERSEADEEPRGKKPCHQLSVETPKEQHQEREVNVQSTQVTRHLHQCQTWACSHGLKCHLLIFFKLIKTQTLITQGCRSFLCTRTLLTYNYRFVKLETRLSLFLIESFCNTVVVKSNVKCKLESLGRLWNWLTFQ